MNKLLTIATPTFNRAQTLDRQITWLAKVIKGFESECEVFISDNCSTDNTQDVIAKWQSELGHTVLKSNRSSENVGLLRNVAYCLNAARTPFVWTVGDDDSIQDGTLAYVLETLKKHSDIALLLLNFSARNQATGLAVKPPEVVGDRWADRACNSLEILSKSGRHGDFCRYAKRISSRHAPYSRATSTIFCLYS